jgi:tRNA threonylcarbamoyladenosine biosynthesis protein TsaE
MKKVFTCSDEADYERLAPEILQSFNNQRLICLYGGMGAGKTTLVKALCHSLGVTENISSPTFSLVNEYTGAGAVPVYHFDFYRIRSESEVFDLGYEEYFFSGCYCFVEWPEKILNLLPREAVTVSIRVENGTRVITVSHE